MLYTVVRILLISVCCTSSGLSAMHMLQAQRYQIPALRKELRRYGGLLRTDVIVAVVASLINWYLPILLSMVIQKEMSRENLSNWLMLALALLMTGILYLQKSRIPQRKPFTWTQRMCRLMGMVFLINLLGAIALNLLTLSPYLMFAGGDYVVLLAAFIMRPIEDRFNARLYNSARKRLNANKKLIRIGITGSYGKTETKLILAALLSEKYKVLVTPPSFSSMMGIARTVNEQLRDGHQVFIAELGAQKKGEIKEMARLLRPRYGVLTCIGSAHMDSFGSLEAVAQAKYELIQCLPETGIAFFGSDGSYGDRLYRLCKHEKYRSGMGTNKECFMIAEHMETGVNGTRFELVSADGERKWVHTRLLGSYSVRNITLAATVARKMGLSMDEIARGVEKIKPIRHHLRLIPGEINLIDDSLNALPDAATEALGLLREFPGRRILVTAGLMEDGGDASEKNYAFGTQAVGCVDYAILIGPEDTRDVMRGLMSAGFPKASVRMVRETEDAIALVREIAGKGDTVLYEGVYLDEEE